MWTGKVPKIRVLSATTAVGWIVQGGCAAGIEVAVVVVRLAVGGRAAMVAESKCESVSGWKAETRETKRHYWDLAQASENQDLTPHILFHYIWQFTRLS